MGRLSAHVLHPCMFSFDDTSTVKGHPSAQTAVMLCEDPKPYICIHVYIYIYSLCILYPYMLNMYTTFHHMHSCTCPGLIGDVGRAPVRLPCFDSLSLSLSTGIVITCVHITYPCSKQDKPL